MTMAQEHDPAVWRGPEMARKRDWLYGFTSDDIAEIEAAVAALRGRDMLTVTRADFPLPRLGAFLRDMQKEIIEGRGFETWCVSSARHRDMARALKSGTGPGTRIVARA